MYRLNHAELPFQFRQLVEKSILQIRLQLTPTLLDKIHLKGLAIKVKLDDYYGAEVNHGRLNPNMDTLVEKDHIKVGKLDDC